MSAAPRASNRLTLRGLPIGDDPARTISVAVPLAAALAGVAFAADAGLGVALTLALVYLPLALINLELAIVLWFPLAFLEALPAFNLAVKAGGLLLVSLWLASVGHYRGRAGAIVAHDRWLWTALGGLLLWVTLSLLWAADRGEVLADVWRWYADALLMIIIATTITRPRSIRWLMGAFVVGAVLSVSQGIASGGLSTSSAAVFSESEGRLAGGLGDPNFLAAAIIPAMILSLSLIPSTRGLLTRWALLGVLPLLAIGLAASESRGGILAAMAASTAAIVVFKRQRGWVIGFVTIAATVIAAWFMISPTAWDRITETENGGSGRSDLWAVAWRIVEDKPVLGVGLNNYTTVSSDYVREPGSLERVDLILDDGEVVHNAYLQLLAETGVLGLALFLLVAVGSIRASWDAVRRFEASGERSLETLARGAIVALVGMLAASFFISNGVDKRLWVLLALGPALAAMARGSETRHPESAADLSAGGVSGRGVPVAGPSI